MALDVADTIVALSSAPGAGARAVLRLSGPRAVDLATAVFAPHADWVPRQPCPGRLRWTAPAPAGPCALPASALLFVHPRSYTGEDVVELHTLAAPPLVADLLRVLIAAGARPAEAGEFTRRAVLNGKLDLTAAEGVAALIAADHDAELRAAHALLEGHLARTAERWQAALAEALALVEAGLDFVDEGIGFVAAADLAARIHALRQALGGLLAAAASAARSSAVPRVALAGRPNAGKSSLFNALSGLDRAICSPLAGTTRDVLQAPLRVSRGEPPVDLLDMAGLEDAAAPGMDQAMHAHARQALASADAVLWVLDATDPVTTPPADLAACLRGSVARRVVATKLDLLPTEQVASRLRRLADEVGVPVCGVSAHTSAGLDDLRQRIQTLVHADRPTAAAGSESLSARHREAVLRAEAALARVEALLGAATPAADLLPAPELLALELREALDHLGRITGQTTPDDVLGLIFSRFCIGK